MVAVAATVFARDIGLYRRWCGSRSRSCSRSGWCSCWRAGMTSRLREMAAAAAAMARGEHGQRVSVHGRDEVAELARRLQRDERRARETDRMRRELVANVSHELRTPLSALQATLENIDDGVQPKPIRETIRAMHQQV